MFATSGPPAPPRAWVMTVHDELRASLRRGVLRARRKPLIIRITAPTVTCSFPTASLLA